MKLYLGSSDSEFYTLTGLINSGKSSVQVYKAQSKDGRMFAVKIFSNPKGEVSQHFNQERDIVVGLNHPHILKYFDFYEKAQYRPPRGVTKQCSAIIMEYVPHGDLFSMITKGALSEKFARALFKQMLDSLEYLHNSGVAHLDLKPENFLLNSRGIKLIDFDFSHRLDRRAQEGAKGTPCYRSPELGAGELKDSIKSDIYSLGVVLFTMVAGCPPYEEIETSHGVWQFDKFYQAYRKNKKLFWDSHSGFKKQAGQEVFSEEFKELIDSMMAEDYEKRPSIDQIREMNWFNGEAMDDEEFQEELKKYIE